MIDFNATLHNFIDTYLSAESYKLIILFLSAFSGSVLRLSNLDLSKYKSLFHVFTQEVLVNTLVIFAISPILLSFLHYIHSFLNKNTSAKEDLLFNVWVEIGGLGFFAYVGYNKIFELLTNTIFSKISNKK